MSKSTQSQNILILGSTGPLGLHVVGEAIAVNWNITLFVRSPEKLTQAIKDSPNVKVIVGQLAEATEIFKLLPSFDTIISILGPTSMRYKFGPLTAFYTSLLQAISALPKTQQPYVLTLSTPSQDAPQDTWPWSMSLMISLFSRMVPGAYNEIPGINTAFQTYGKEVTWTQYRVGNLTDGKAKGIATAGWVGDKRWNLNVDRLDIASWLIQQAQCSPEKRQWVGKFPALCAPQSKTSPGQGYLYPVTDSSWEFSY